MNWVLTFQIAVCAFAIVLVYLVLTDTRSEYIFPCAILMICAGFLSYRYRLKQRIESRTADEEQD